MYLGTGEPQASSRRRQVQCGDLEEAINIKTEEEVQVQCGGWEEAKTIKEERRSRTRLERR